jgi:outer membrane protein TolC
MTKSAAAAILGMAAILAAGCSAQFYTQQADQDAYRIVGEKNEEGLQRKREFTIKPRTDLESLLAEIRAKNALLDAEDPAPIPTPPAPAEGKAATAEAQPNVSPVPQAGPNTIRLTVADALRVAVRASREYQSQKEALYLTALGLTASRYQFQPHPAMTGSTTFTSNGAGGTRQEQWSGASDIGISQQLLSGAVVTADLGLTALHFLYPGVADAIDSTLGFTFNQPLWRGANPTVVRENLVQSERNVLYAVRNFARYEQTFAVDIASQYLQVIQQRDVVLNTWRSYQSLKNGREQAEWLAKAERLAEFAVDQARQSELSAYNSWVVSRQNYINALDSFKLSLGLPLATDIVLDPNELKRLDAEGLRQNTVPLEEATSKALTSRLDLLNTVEGMEDAERKIVLAEDALKGEVDLVASIAYASDNPSPRSARLSLKKGNYSIGLSINLPIDRLNERNALRQTQISRDQVARSLDLTRDQVRLAVRQALRQLEQTRETYDIQKLSVTLAERRVESTRILLQAGRATQRDVLDAEGSLLDARNSLTSALVAHSIAELQFQRDVGTLVVDEEGQIHGWNLTSPGR